MSDSTPPGKVYVAVVGCSHGEVDKIYEVIDNIEKRRGIKVGLVLCSGDFQSVRNMTDLRCMACPIKYQAMHDFHRYYSGEKSAPIPTLFIGGNHEASNYLQELPYGGWVAPNIYYCGNVSVLKWGPVRIAGLSGIYKGHDYLKGRYESPPYDNSTMRSVYHYRNLDIFRLKQIKTPVDIMLSHDWPKGIHVYGNTNRLLRTKPFFRNEIERNELGSRPLFELLNQLQPRYWFAAHLHVKFAAIVPHDQTNTIEKQSTDETEEGSAQAGKSDQEQKPCSSLCSEKSTHFLALDKVLPKRQFLQIIEIPINDDTGTGDFKLCYDPEWLAILKSTDELLQARNTLCYMPNETGSHRYDYSPTPEEINDVNEAFEGNLRVPDNFSRTAQIYVEGQQPERAIPIANPQTTEFCSKLKIRDPLRLVGSLAAAPRVSQSGTDFAVDPDNSQLDITYNDNSYSELSLNPDEISLDDEEEMVPSTTEADRTETPGNGSKQPSKLILPPPKSGGDEEEGGKELDGKTQGGRSELEILRSVMGPGFGLESSHEPETLAEPGISFVLDRKGEPDTKRRRNQQIYNQDDDE